MKELREVVNLFGENIEERENFNIFVNEDSSSMLTESKIHVLKDTWKTNFKSMRLTKKQAAIFREIQKTKDKGISSKRIRTNLNMKDNKMIDLILVLLIIKGYIYRKRISPEENAKTKAGTFFDMARYKFYSREFANGVQFDLPIWWNKV